MNIAQKAFIAAMAVIPLTMASLSIAPSATSSSPALSVGQSIEVTCSGTQLTEAPVSATAVTDSCGPVIPPTTTTTTIPPTTTTIPPTTTTTVPPVQKAPPAVTNLKATVSAGSVVLAWTNNGTAPSETDGVDVYRGGTKIAWPLAVSTYIDSSPGTGNVTYAVQPYNGAGLGVSTSVTVTVGSTTTTTTVPGGGGSVATVQGLYTGSVSGSIQLGQALGLNPLKGYSYYCDGSTWSSISSCSPASGLPSGTIQLVGLNLTPDGAIGDNQSASNLATFRSVASHFVGTPVVFRLGWEFDGNWFSWGNGVNGNTPASFAAATGVVIPAMKTIDPAAQFDFSDNVGSSTAAQLAGYMGGNAALWNYVGGDHYDFASGGGNASTMNAVVTYASSLGKPVSLGEWGLRGTNDPNFIAAMCQFITNPAASSAANGFVKYSVGPTSYFSLASYGSDITQYPSSETVYKADCG